MTDEKSDLGFDLRTKLPMTHAFIQWKGTDVCMDFRCDCGSNEHIDAMFVYFVKCHKCGTVWEMPTYLFPRKNHAKEQR